MITGLAPRLLPRPRRGTTAFRQFREDRNALQQLAADPNIDLTAKIPHGSGQTYLRELVLAADHAAYHIGQLVVVRRLLGNWKRVTPVVTSAEVVAAIDPKL